MFWFLKAKNSIDDLEIDSLTKQLIHNAVASASKTIEDVMIDRSQVIELSDNITISKFQEVFLAHQHSRYPIVNSDQEAVGILLAKDVFSTKLKQSDHITKLIRNTVYISENERINQALLKLQNSRRHLAIVLDEYGNYSGIVTIENILESLVGAIEDEHDQLDTGLRRISKDQYICPGSMQISDLNHILGLHISHKHYETLSGIISHHHGKIPTKGDLIIIENLKFQVLAANDKVIQKLSITLLSK
jgi:magnesium and cobalt transporter